MTDYSLNTQKQIDLLASDFELAWGTEAAFSIETVLDGNQEVNRKLLLAELLLLEFELRQAETLTIGPFLERFPNDQTAVKGAWQTFQEEHKSDEAKQSTPRIELDATILSAAEEPGADELQATVSDGRGPRQNVAPDLKMGRYLILEEIGHGGMGVVYRAHDPEMKRDVALKVIQAGALAKESDKRRFRREAEAVSKLSHPNIVPVFDCQLSDQQAYFAMQFIQGQTIQDATENGLFKPEDAADILIRVAEAIQHAHEQKIIHRDLKPQNIILKGKDRHPWVVDFGLAANLADAELTQTGELVGTPKYMAPEQISSKYQVAFANTGSQETDAERVDENTSLAAPTDIYGLGGLLYFMLSGRAPHNGTSFTEVLQAVTSEEPDSLLDNPKIPRDLATICHKCLQKDPRDRYESAADLSADLKRYKNHEPIHARPTPILKRASKWVRRNPWPTRFIATLGLFAFIAAGSAIAFQGIAQSESEAKTEAIAAQNAAIKAREQAEATQKQLEETVGQLRDENVGRTIAEAQGALATGDFERFRDITKQFDTINGDRNPAQARLMKAALRENTQPRMIESRRVVDGNWNISCAALSPDEKQLVALDGASLISVFDVETFQVKHRLTRGFFIGKEEVLEDGRIIPYGHFYDSAVMAAVPDLSPVESMVYTSVCWAGTPLRVVATQADGKVVLLDAEKPVGEKTMVDRIVWQGDCALTNSASGTDSDMVLVGDLNGALTLLSLAKDAVQGKFAAESEVTCIVSHTDGWLVGTRKGQMFSFTSDLTLKDKYDFGASIWSIAISDQKVIVAGEHPFVQKLNLRNGLVEDGRLSFSSLVELGRRVSAYVCVQFEDENVWGFDDIGRAYVWGSNGKCERVGHLSKFTRDRSIIPTRSPNFRSVVFCQSLTKGLLTADQVGNVSLFELRRPRQGAQFSELPIQLGPNPRIVCSEGGKPIIWSINDAGTLRAINPDGTEAANVEAFGLIERGGVEKATAQDLFPGGTDLVAHSDGRIFTVGLEPEVKVWRLVGEKLNRTSLRLNAERPLMSVAVCEKHSLVASVDVKSRLNIWDLETGRRTHVLSMLADDLPVAQPLTGKLAFNSDGSMLAAFGAGQAGVVYSTANWKPLDFSIEVAGVGGVDLVWSRKNSAALVRSDSRRVGNFVFESNKPGSRSKSIQVPEYLHADENLFLGVDSTGRLALRSQRTGIELFRFDIGFGSICDLTASSDDGVFMATRDGRLISQRQDRRLGQEAISQRQTVPSSVRDVISKSSGYTFFGPSSICQTADGQQLVAAVCGKGDPWRGGEMVLASRNRGDAWEAEVVFSDSDRPVYVGAFSLQSDPIRLAFRAITDAEIYRGDLLLLTESAEGRWVEELVHGQANTGLNPSIITNPATGKLAVFHHDAMYRDIVVSEQGDATERGWPMRRLVTKAGAGLTISDYDGRFWGRSGRMRVSSDDTPHCFVFDKFGLTDIPVPPDVGLMHRFVFSSNEVPMILCHSRIDQSISVRAWQDSKWSIIARVPEITANPRAISQLALGPNDEIIIPITRYDVLSLLLYRDGKWESLTPDCDIRDGDRGIAVFDIAVSDDSETTLLIGPRGPGPAWLKSVDIKLPFTE